MPPPATATITPNGYNLGQGGYSSFQRIQLPGLGTTPKPQTDDDKQEDPVINFRKGILYYFGNCELPQLSLKDVKTAVSDGKSKGTDIKTAIDNAKSGTRDTTTIASKIQDELKKMESSAPAWLTSASTSAANEIQKHLPSILNGMINTVSKMSVPIAGDLKDFCTEMVEAVRKAKAYWKTRGLDEALQSGEPKVIVDKLREELAKDAAIAFAKAMYSAAKVVAGALTGMGSSVVTGVIDAVAAFLNYIWELYKKARDYFALKDFFADCKKKFTANDSVIFSAENFTPWFSTRVGDMPIIACHCICSRMNGSYCGFLSTLIEGEELKTAYGKFVDLRDPAVDYAKKYYFEFTSSDPQVKMCLNIIQKGGVDMTNGQAAQSIGWFRRTCMKYGLMTNTNYK